MQVVLNTLLYMRNRVVGDQPGNLTFLGRLLSRACIPAQYDLFVF